MKINKSPWIHQLDQTRKAVSLNGDIDTDIAIVGAGIAGISTAFFLLKYTNERVVVLEQGKLAHGATGHNAGQVISHFERSLEELEKEFGFEQTRDALQALDSTWSLIDEMYSDAKLDIIFSKTEGHMGLSNLYQLITCLKDKEIEVRSDIKSSKILVSDAAPFKDSIPKVFEKLYTLASQKEILEKMESEDKGFHAVVIDKAACINSALFCQEIVKYLLTKFSDRFSLYENTRINKVILNKNNAVLDAGKHTVNSGKVILCTNGFENFEIFNQGGLAIDKNFHHLIKGRVGYMSGYLENMNKPPTALVYQIEDYDQSKEDPYFYLTRRPHEMGDKKHNLICVGGPELPIDDRAEYLRDYDYPEEMPMKIDQFIKKEYDTDPNHKIDYEFTWHGLMGYTPNRVRLIGEEPKNRVLLYNLGCNGIGIIPSIYGGRRVARIIAGEKMRPSIFDPKGE